VLWKQLIQKDFTGFDVSSINQNYREQYQELKEEEEQKQSRIRKRLKVLREQELELKKANRSTVLKKAPILRKDYKKVSKPANTLLAKLKRDTIKARIGISVFPAKKSVDSAARGKMVYVAPSNDGAKRFFDKINNPLTYWYASVKRL
jgi:hypothetical protein